MSQKNKSTEVHRQQRATYRGRFKEWPLVQWPTTRRPLMKINFKKFALQLPKQDFYSFKLCTVHKVHAVRPVDNNNDMPFPSHKFNLLNVWVAWPRCCGWFALGDGFEEWPLVQWPMRPLPYGPRRPLMKINKKICITAAKTGFLLLQTVYGR